MKVAVYNHKRKYNYEFKTCNSGIVGVHGISGSGKSSLLDAIAGYDDKVKGTIEYNGKSLSGVINCAYMNQHPILFEHWTVKENLDFVKKYHNIAYDDYVKQLNCSDLLDKYPSQLSGGEKQRIAFIRTLIQIKQGAIVLLDEPFSALNRDLRKVALGILQNQNNCLMFLVTHDVNELYEVADELLYIENGKIEYHAPIDKAMSQSVKDLPLASKISLKTEQHIIYADDVSISLKHNDSSSIQHQIECSIISITSNNNICLLELNLTKSQQLLYAKITTQSLNKLNLKVNDKVIANFKALSYQ